VIRILTIKIKILAVVTAVILVLAGFIAFVRARSMSAREACIANMRQIEGATNVWNRQPPGVEQTNVEQRTARRIDAKIT